jgi:Fe-S-cluster formation regulator IscX/YfhJ
MSIYPPSISRCQHLKVNGTQCGSPALRRGQFCFFHKSWHETRIVINGNRARRARFVMNLPVLEDANSIQVSLMQVMRGILTGQLEQKTAGLLLYALQTASSNLGRIHFEPMHKEEIVIDPRTVDQTQLGEDVWAIEDYEDDEQSAENIEIDASGERDIDAENEAVRREEAEMERTIAEIEGATGIFLPQPNLPEGSVVAAGSQAAKRRQNAAHGASRGWKQQNGKAPEERKKSCDKVSEVEASEKTIAEIKAIAVGSRRQKRPSTVAPRRQLSLVASQTAPDTPRIKPERRVRRSHAIN